MSLLNSATPAAAAPEPGKDTTAAPEAAGGDGKTTAVPAPAQTASTAEPAKDAADFTAESFAQALKNEDVYKDGKIFGKYANIEEAAKGYKELVGQMVNRPKAPETYDLTQASVKDKPELKISADDPYTQALMPVLKKHNISQEAFNEMASVFLETQAGSFINAENEMKALGDGGQAMINNVATHVLAKVPEEMKADVLELTQTAGGIRVLNWMLKGKVEASIPVEASATMRKTAAEWGAEADAYDKQHKATIGMDKSQQDHYDMLRRRQAEALLAEKAGAKA